MIRVVLLSEGFTAERRRNPAAFYRVICRVAGALTAALLALGALSPALRAADGDLNSRMLALVNAARAEAGAGPLSLDPRLSDAACVQARDLALGGPLSHQGRDGSTLADRVTRTGYRFAMAAENLAAGAPTPDETVWLWMSSPGHRRNILTAEFNQAGAAYVPGDGAAIWVLVLATPRTGSSATTYETKPASPGNPRPRETGAARQNRARSGVLDNPSDDKRLTCY